MLGRLLWPSKQQVKHMVCRTAGPVVRFLLSKQRCIGLVGFFTVSLVSSLWHCLVVEGPDFESGVDS